MKSAAVALALALLSASPAGAREYRYVTLSDGGSIRCGDAPANWQKPDGDEAGFVARQLQPDRGPPGVARPDGGAQAEPPDAGVGCAGTMYLRWHFSVGGELSKLATTTLRIRYAHGFAAYLNGVEIARRRLAPGADAAATATDYHGPEFESVYVPVKPGLLRARGNVLAVEVHPHTAGKHPYAEVELGGADGARIVRGPYLTRLGEHEVTVELDTDLPTLAEVRWGATEAYGKIDTDAPAARHHALRLTGLPSGAVVHYRVRVRPGSAAVALTRGLPVGPDPGPPAPASASDANDDGVVDAGDAAFHTPPARDQPLRFAVYGDTRTGHDIHALLDQRLLEEDPDLAILTGDLVDMGSDDGDWEKFFDIARTLLRQLAIFPAPGNHEYARLGHGISKFLSFFRWPVRPGEDDAAFYSFDLSGVHFVALDSHQYRSARQLAWFGRDLAEARRSGARAIFVYAHEPCWSTGLHGDNATCIHDYAPLMEKNHVAMFFAGHDHDYERGRVGALNYLVTGGAGAGLRWAHCGVPGKRACPPHVFAFANEHHYVMVEVLPHQFRICPKRIDGTPLEPCVDLPLPGSLSGVSSSSK
ncbi:MAG TPA: metallophosphoesterase [Polyangia bacterium]